MLTIYIDADACPVKDEIYKVAERYAIKVVVVANAPLRVPATAELVVRGGFGAADDYIAEVTGVGDIVITADIPLAARALANQSRVLGTKGYPFTENDIGEALGMRELAENRRAHGEITRGPSPMTPKDRSRFLSKLDEMVNAAKRENPK